MNKIKAICAMALSLAVGVATAGQTHQPITDSQALRLLDEEPGLTSKVASANGLNSMRFLSQETPTIAAMVRDYVARRDKRADGGQEQEQARAQRMLEEEPGLADKVATANGLSKIRMMSQENSTIAAMVLDYVKRRERNNTSTIQRTDSGLKATSSR